MKLLCCLIIRQCRLNGTKIYLAYFVEEHSLSHSEHKYNWNNLTVHINI